MDFLYGIKIVMGYLMGFLYNISGNWGVAIILFTVVVKVLLIPLAFSQIKSTRNMQKIQPLMTEIQNKYKNDKEVLNQKLIELYKEHKYNPLSGCLPMLIQLPIIFALFDVLRLPETYVFAGDVALAQQATLVNFLWIKDLAMPDLINNMINIGVSFPIPGLLSIAAAGLTYFQMKTMNVGTANATANSQMKSMEIMMPIMILWFGTTMSAGVTLYWVVSTLFQIIQQMYMPTVQKEAK